MISRMFNVYMQPVESFKFVTHCAPCAVQSQRFLGEFHSIIILRLLLQLQDEPTQRRGWSGKMDVACKNYASKNYTV